MSALTDYFRGSIEELRHVQWATRQQAIRLSLITIGFIAVTSVFFGIVDLLYTEIIRITLS